MRILLLCSRPATTAATISDHIDALSRYSRHSVFCFPYVGVTNNRLPDKLALSGFDALVIHYSVYLLNDIYLAPEAKQQIAAFKGAKLLFMQDEYRDVNRAIDAMLDLGVHTLFTCVPDDQVDKVYPASRLAHVEKIINLTGYVPEKLLAWPAPPLTERPIDVGYRARMVPFWLGALGAEKWQIVPKFLEATRDANLTCDLSCREEDRLYGRRWTQFIANCRTVLGVESGASVFDFTGEIRAKVNDYLLRNPVADFADVQDRFLLRDEGKVRLNQISPRLFEAAALKTGMVLYEGEYSGILKPWRHYIPLKKDFSNIGLVVESVRDIAALQRMVDRTYEEVARNPLYSYRRFVALFDEAVDRACGRLLHEARDTPSQFKFQALVAPFAILASLLRLWLSIPERLRARIKPAVAPLTNWIRKP